MDEISTQFAGLVLPHFGLRLLPLVAERGVRQTEEVVKRVRQCVPGRVAPFNAHWALFKLGPI